MNRKLKGLFLVPFLWMAGLFIGNSYSYLTDSETAVNSVIPGALTTEIVEEFPSVTPVPPDKDSELVKKVQIINGNSADSHTVDCFVRAKILFSNSELGDHTLLHGMDSEHWILDSDGYYYYSSIVPAGGSTTPLFQSVSIQGSSLPENQILYSDDFRILIYEESIQAGSFEQWRDAWNYYLSDVAEKEQVR